MMYWLGNRGKWLDFIKGYIGKLSIISSLGKHVAVFALLMWEAANSSLCSMYFMLGIVLKQLK